MSILDRLLFLIGLRPKTGPRYYELTDNLQITLTTLAKHEGRPEQEILPDLVAAGLTHYHSVDELWTIWESLTAREREVTALTCLGLTNQQIAARLSLSRQTIKSHIRTTFAKFGVNSKQELRHILASWDFDQWM